MWRSLLRHLGSVSATAGLACGASTAFASDAISLRPLTSDSAPAALGAPTSSSGSGPAVVRQVIAGGGGRSSGGVYVISATIGQADADPLQPSSGGAYAITGGFWSRRGPVLPSDALFANGFESP